MTRQLPLPPRQPIADRGFASAATRPFRAPGPAIAFAKSARARPRGGREYRMPRPECDSGEVRWPPLVYSIRNAPENAPREGRGGTHDNRAVLLWNRQPIF